MKAKPDAQSKKRRSRFWYLLPIFLQVIGGLVAYFMLKGNDYAIARNSLWIGIVLTAITTSAAVLLYEDFQSDMTAAQQRIANGGSRIANTANGTLEYSDVGNGYPVLVIHGAGGGYDQGLLLSKIFFGDDSGNQFRVIAPSRFGFLHTPIPDGSSSNNNQKSSFAAQADAYADLLDKLNIKKVGVVGFSAGGPSSIEFALRHPDKTSGLVLASAVVHKEPPMNFIDNVIHNGFFKSDFAFWFIGKYLQP